MSKMSNKYFSKMYILLRIIALVFDCAPLFSVQQQHSLLSHASPTPDSKIDMFAWLSNIYRWKIYLWHVSYASE